jgi:hypothetical protein
MISASQEANLTLVEKRRINEAFLRTSVTDTPVVSAPTNAQVFTATVKQPTIRQPAPEPGLAVLQPEKTIQLQKPEYVQPQERGLVEPQERKLDDEFNL